MSSAEKYSCCSFWAVVQRFPLQKCVNFLPYSTSLPESSSRGCDPTFPLLFYENPALWLKGIFKSWQSSKFLTERQKNPACCDQILMNNASWVPVNWNILFPVKIFSIFPNPAPKYVWSNPSQGCQLPLPPPPPSLPNISKYWKLMEIDDVITQCTWRHLRKKYSLTPIVTNLRW